MRRVLIAMVRLYQLALSPLFPPCCRFTPSCSRYAIEALERHGCWRGLYLACRRILRCHPFHPGGFDPVVPSPREAACECRLHPTPNREEISSWKPNAL